MVNKKRARIKNPAWFLSIFAAVLLALTFVGAGTTSAIELGGGGGDTATVPAATTLYIDIKPQSWPNPINVNSKGVLPVAILGSADLDVTAYSFDTNDITLEGVQPLRFDIEDISSPEIGAGGCNENTEGGDGYLDITLKFDTQEVVQALSELYGPLEDGQELPLTLNATLTGAGGTTLNIIGSDCVVIRAKK